MRRLRTTCPFILSQTRCGWGLLHQRCSIVINGIDGEVKERAHALSRQPTMTLVAIAIWTRANVLFPMIENHDGEALPRGQGCVGHEAVRECEAIIASTKDCYPVVVEKNLGTGFLMKKGNVSQKWVYDED
ncbi:hypothetical protein NPIL_640201 [Nephila pilipes]|uniref:Uncharacterized protein n=1 Tax=Nephila pilipes TaxID=299642 RepID=A0A8X6TLV5_NEPPI|nr:hypothetical protein NPIL_640201 [Nephila pilipes]